MPDPISDPARRRPGADWTIPISSIVPGIIRALADVPRAERPSVVAGVVAILLALALPPVLAAVAGWHWPGR